MNKRNANKTRIVIEIEKSLNDEIRKRAKSDGVTITQYIKELLIANVCGNFEPKHNEIYKKLVKNKYFIIAMKTSIKDALAPFAIKEDDEDIDIIDSKYGLSDSDYENVCNNSKFQNMSEEDKIKYVNRFMEYKRNSSSNAE